MSPRNRPTHMSCGWSSSRTGRATDPLPGWIKPTRNRFMSTTWCLLRAPIRQRHQVTFINATAALEGYLTRDSRPEIGMDQAYAQSFYVNYVVFAPGADKTKASGHVYQRNRGAGGVPYPGQSPRTSSSAEYSLKYAGRETADRVLDSLGILGPGGVIKN